LGELAKYGMRVDASALRRHPDGRRLATLLATVRFLEGKSVDDTLELLDLLMATELVNKAQTASNKEKVRKHSKLAARLAVAVEAFGWWCLRSWSPTSPRRRCSPTAVRGHRPVDVRRLPRAR
jgi:hypothetical protein